MVTLGPMKFGGGTSRLHLDSSYGAAALSTAQTSSSSSSSSSTSSSLSSLRCKMHNNFAAVILGRDLLDTQRAVGGGATTTTTSKPHHRPPNGKERDLSSSSRSPKTSNGSGLVHNSGGSGTYSHAFDVEHTSRCRNVTNQLPISSPGSPAQYRRLESRRVLPEESPKRQLPFNPGMTRKTALTPRACRKAVVTEVRTDQARVVHQVNKTTTAVGRSTSGLPKFHLNEQPSAGSSANGNKCRSINCKSSGMGAHNRLGGGGVDKRDTSQPRTSLTGHTISSMNKIVKSSMSSSNTSRDTSIESIVPKYKTMGQNSGGQSSGQLSPRSAAEELGVSSPQKRSYNPQMLVRTNKFILNDEKVVSRKTSVVIPRIRSSLNESEKSKGGGITHHIPIYRDLEEKVSVVPTQASNGTGNAFISKVMKENRPTTAVVGCRAEVHDQRVPDTSVRSLLNNHRRPLYDDCDRDFFNKDPSNESLYIDFSKKRSPMTTTNTNGRSHGCDVHLSPLRPINKDVLLQRGVESAAVTCDYTYQFEAARKQRVEQSGVARNNSSNSERLAKVLPSVFYVSCASWVPKCNNKFSLRERRLLEESKTISRKR